MNQNEFQLVTHKPELQVANQIIACCRVSKREEDIFPLWLEHYRPHVDGIAVVIVAENGEGTLGLQAICEQANVRHTLCQTERFHTWHSMAALQELVRQIDAAWVLHADSDEFLREIAEVRSFVEQMAAENADHAFAWMKDRLAEGGHLRSVEHLRSVWELENTFPIEAAVTSRLARACPFKVCLSRWPETGYIHRKGDGQVRQMSRMLTLDHFKWRAGLAGRLQKRIEDHAASGLPWGDESQRILDELRDYGRLRSERWQGDSA
jgi:hypothetical protein